MPNWCENRVEISLDESVDGKSFLLKYGEIHHTGGNDYLWKLDYNNLIPTPDEVLKTLKVCKFPEDDTWYYWRKQNWGVKWNAVDDIETDKSNWIQVEYDTEWNNAISFSYETPWNPPEGIAKAFQQLDEVNNVVWFYDEPNMQIAGYIH